MLRGEELMPSHPAAVPRTPQEYVEVVITQHYDHREIVPFYALYRGQGHLVSHTTSGRRLAPIVFDMTDEEMGLMRRHLHDLGYIFLDMDDEESIMAIVARAPPLAEVRKRYPNV